MDGQRFDELARVFGASLNRKRFLALIAGIGAPAVLADGAAAKRRRNSKGRKPSGGGDLEPQGGEPTCSGACESDGECDSNPECVCDEAEGVCQAPICGGSCLKDVDCPQGGGCGCDTETNQCVTETCGGLCFKDLDCGIGGGCVCNTNTNECVTVSCPGACGDNGDCREQGQDNCVCFLGPEVDVSAAVGAEGVLLSGSCGACLGAGEVCDASTECCGQLVCQGGRCQRKRKPKKKERCAKSGKACSQDPGCCAQAICYRGECGEKDSHCDSDNECARGYSCVGGRLTGGHRRCRRNRRKPPRNRRNRG